MVARIARKEFLEMTRDGRFRWSAVILLALLIAALATGWLHYYEFQSQQLEAQRQTYEQWDGQGLRNPHGATHFGLYAFKPRQPLSLIDKGVDAYLGTAVWLESHYQNPLRYRPAEDATGLQRFADLTAATILQLLLPLVIILLAFPAFAGEKEAGTLRQILSLGVPARTLALGKLLGQCAVLALLVVPAAIAGALALTLASTSTTAPFDWLRVVGMAVGYLLYLGFFVAFSLAVSAWSASSRTALVVLLAFWTVSSFLEPRLLSDLSERLHPGWSGPEFWGEFERQKEARSEARERRYAEVKRELLRRHGADDEDELPVQLGGVSLQVGEQWTSEIFDDLYRELWTNYERQIQIHQLGSIFSPLPAVRLLSMGMAGTDIRHHRFFAQSAETYRRAYVKQMNDDLAYNSNKDPLYFAGRELWEKTPRFSYELPSGADAIAWQRGNLATLAVWFAGGVLLSILAAARLKAV